MALALPVQQLLEVDPMTVEHVSDEAYVKHQHGQSKAGTRADGRPGVRAELACPGVVGKKERTQTGSGDEQPQRDGAKEVQRPIIAV